MVSHIFTRRPGQCRPSSIQNSVAAFYDGCQWDARRRAGPTLEGRSNRFKGERRRIGKGQRMSKRTPMWKRTPMYKSVTNRLGISVLSTVKRALISYRSGDHVWTHSCLGIFRWLDGSFLYGKRQRLLRKATPANFILLTRVEPIIVSSATPSSTQRTIVINTFSCGLRISIIHDKLQITKAPGPPPQCGMLEMRKRR